MREFSKWLKMILRKRRLTVLAYMEEEIIKDTWKAALSWYQEVANKCEQDCSTNEDYKILYFHLKQVLINELKEREE